MGPDTKDVFVSYRRDEDSAHAGRLMDRLSAHFGDHMVFRDIDSIEIGGDFVEAIESALDSSDVLIAVIGKNWLTVTNAAGQKRLENPDDYVRIEIATALQRNIRVVPVLVQEASMPSADELPDDLALLARRQAVELHESTWREGVQRLIDRLDKLPPLPMSAESIRDRYRARMPVSYGIRLVPSQKFRKDGFLGPEARRYVFIGDYAEQRGRSLRQVLSSLWMGDAYDQVTSANLAWTAVIFEIGGTNRLRLDLMPATWKAIFRILSSENRLAMISLSTEEKARLGSRTRDYYEGDQGYWLKQITSQKAFEIEGKQKLSPYDMLRTYFGYQDQCFALTGGTGICGRDMIHGLNLDGTRTPSRLFLVKNAEVESLNCRIKELGHVDDKVILN
jgi:hypothetical protein